MMAVSADTMAPFDCTGFMRGRCSALIRPAWPIAQDRSSMALMAFEMRP
jgi:hypothetical protein